MNKGIDDLSEAERDALRRQALDALVPVQPASVKEDAIGSGDISDILAKVNENRTKRLMEEQEHRDKVRNEVMKQVDLSIIQGMF